MKNTKQPFTSKGKKVFFHKDVLAHADNEKCAEDFVISANLGYAFGHQDAVTNMEAKSQKLMDKFGI